jgi:serine/threonine protein kinase
VINRIKCSNKRAVYRVIDNKTDTDAILKIIIKRNISKNSLAILHFIKSCTHKNIYKIYEIGEVGGFYVILSKYITGQSFGKFMKHLQKREHFIKVLYGILNGLAFLHETCIQHVDIKPSNIIVDENMNSVLIDFDLAKNISDEYINDKYIMGTFPYIPRETFDKKKYYLKSDIWSLGASIVRALSYCDRDTDSPDTSKGTKSSAMITREYMNNHKTYYMEYACADISKYKNLLGNDMVDMVKNMLSIDVNDRPSSDELYHTVKKLLKI